MVEIIGRRTHATRRQIVRDHRSPGRAKAPISAQSIGAELGVTKRTVYRDTSRIIAAWCELREGFRYFRTERIVEAEVLEDTIPRRIDLLRAEWSSATDAERKRYEDGV
jgi:predicted DNA-binding transcriptional regulator YafY